MSSTARRTRGSRFSRLPLDRLSSAITSCPARKNASHTCDPMKPAPTKEQLAATGFNRCNVTTSEGGSIDAELTFRGEAHNDLTEVLDDPRVRAGLRCGPLTFPNHKLVPDVRWMLEATRRGTLGRGPRIHPRERIAWPEVLGQDEWPRQPLAVARQVGCKGLRFSEICPSTAGSSPKKRLTRRHRLIRRPRRRPTISRRPGSGRTDFPWSSRTVRTITGRTTSPRS